MAARSPRQQICLGLVGIMKVFEELLQKFLNLMRDFRINREDPTELRYAR